MNRIYLTAPLFLFLSLAACEKPRLLSGDAVLPDGGVYSGHLVNGKFEGHGVLEYSNGQRYVGNFYEGQMSGKGRLVFADGAVYEGEFDNGLVEGRGELTLASGIVYRGRFEKNLMVYGEVADEASGTLYKGAVKNWQYHGEGQLIDKDTSYRGQFKQGYYHGKGELTYSDTASYSGEFEDGFFNGEGEYKSGDDVYKGRFVSGGLTGQGSHSNNGKEIYRGEFDNWVYHGDGKLVDSDGNQYAGFFEYGQLEGEGSFEGVDGARYEGGFKYGKYHGKGKLTLSGSEEYVGEFRYGKYHGAGKLVTGSPERIVVEGVWKKGKLVYNQVNNQYVLPQAELALEKHQSLLEDEVSSLLHSESEKINAYFLGVGGDGTQSVFRRELEYVEDFFKTHFGTKQRSVNLINHHDSAGIHPLATTRSIEYALDGIASKMDRENDILFIYISSHGSKKHALSIKHDDIELADLEAQYFADALEQAKIRWKVIMISACYSGGLVPMLEDEHTFIMTASDAKSTSFGCSEDSEMTYFGKALFKKTLAQQPKMNFVEAFDRAKTLIGQWEKEQGSDSSNPQIHSPQSAIRHLSQWRDQ